ncbi:MAG: hypothetical protein EOP83_01135 [Verrucomicrobiaceae bacterium]|nr:MAG: hypothetical protein EOP83_01135 [Verrucomicrobiaceae bacterium]
MTRIDEGLVRKRARKGGIYHRVAITKPKGVELTEIYDWADQHGSGEYAMMRRNYHQGAWGWLFAFSREEDAQAFKMYWV